ncbi:uncharacterized protein B0I36DRAFT_125019 [Microdochium trichocladiopsis]|uniref:Uncharacterized protein n=1 Tax=Microdochium trichocladiopsis TaxID=1682393 RepID=A0A9P9BR65_9PEZI|nr:uncharacterized protein B0I36DRAFT_125019 [Microdochium trichocladiopsis]KAH7031622.1 hypothetical protein B0I36DRAFT_125019 [Microdochium trichocladiopsis]
MGPHDPICSALRISRGRREPPGWQKLPPPSACSTMHWEGRKSRPFDHGAAGRSHERKRESKPAQDRAGICVLCNYQRLTRITDAADMLSEKVSLTGAALQVCLRTRHGPGVAEAGPTSSECASVPGVKGFSCHVHQSTVPTTRAAAPTCESSDWGRLPRSRCVAPEVVCQSLASHSVGVNLVMQRDKCLVSPLLRRNA